MPGYSFTKAEIERMVAGLPWKEWQQEFEDQFAAEADTITGEAGKASAAEVGGVWSAKHPATARHVANFVGEEITNIDEYTRARLVDVIWDAIDGKEAETMTELGGLMRTAVEDSYVLSPSRALTIARTETATLLNVGQLAAYQQNGIEEVEVSDGDDDEECLPGETLVVAPNILVAFTRWFEGELIELVTAAGDFLSCTPNHPILTGGGWVPARLLREGDEVIRCRDGRRLAALVGADAPDDDDVPTTIEERAKLALISDGSLSVRKASRAHDFHGDGTDGQVHTKTSVRQLADRGEVAAAAVGQQVMHGDLVGAIEQAAALACRRGSLEFVGSALARSMDLGAAVVRAIGRASGARLLNAFFGMFRSAYGSLSCGNTATALQLRQPPAYEQLRGAVVANHEPVFFESTNHRARVTAHRPSDVYAALAKLILFVKPRQPREQVAAQWDTALAKDRREDGPAGVHGRSDLRDRLAGLITPTRLVRINKRRFSGHVYNLGTIQEWYVAGNIVTHNCADADGQVWTLDEALAEPIAHPNCVRSFSPVVPDVEADE